MTIGMPPTRTRSRIRKVRLPAEVLTNSCAPWNADWRFSNSVVTRRRVDSSLRKARPARPAFGYRTEDSPTRSLARDGIAVGYDYDERGRLAAATDLAGGLWSYRYGVDGALTAVIDPRAKTVLAASHAGGRTATVRALHAETTFHYGKATTRAVDGLGRTTTFHRNVEGITTGVADAAGRLTQVAFDAGFRPVSISRDGAAVVRLNYDAAGRLTAMQRPDGDRTFAYGDHGLTSLDGAETARYRYEAGRLARAEDASGEQGYAYTDDGVLASATVAGVETLLSTRSDGTVDGLWRDGHRLLGIEHRADGRVVSMVRADGGVPNTVRYDYDAHRASRCS